MEKGFKYLGEDTREPARALPEDWDGKRICLRFSGGVGDVVVAIGGTARALHARAACQVVAATLDHQMPLLAQMEGVDETVPSTYLNDPAVRAKFDVLLEFSQVFNRTRVLRRGSYYGLVSKRVGIEVKPGKFRFEYAPQWRGGEKLAVVHAGSSNPNRRWDEAKWREVIKGLAARGYAVRCLGTRDEWGLHAPDSDVKKLSEQSDDLLWQAEQCAATHLFVGTDSGFAHVCGVLGVPGAVLFTNTVPEDVIGEYPTLKAVHAYDKLGVKPSRSLRKDDPRALECGAAIEPADVFRVLGLKEPKKKKEEPMLVQPITRLRVLVVAGKGSPALHTIERACDVTYGAKPASEYDAVILIHNKGTRAIRDRTPPWLLMASRTDPDQAMRALREVVTAGRRK